MSVEDEAVKLSQAFAKIDAERKEFLTNLAKDIHGNLVFTDRHIRPGDFESITPSIFMPIIFGALSPKKSKYKGTTVVADEDRINPEDIGMIYEYRSESLPRSINGYPIFMSMRMLNKEEAEFVWEKVRKIQELLDEV